MDRIKIRYSFKLGKEVTETFDLQLDAQTLEFKGEIPEVLPVWARLDFHQCPHCPLDIGDYPNCPLAVNLVNILDRFDSLFSYNHTRLIVTTKDRMVSKVTTVQEAVGSLLGLVIAGSNCPHTVYLRPMARFHLPLASSQETLFRSVTTYLLAQYFLKKDGKDVDFDLVGLKEVYHRVHLVNRYIADRLRAEAKTDSILNAIVQLDVNAQNLISGIEDSLEDLRILFLPYMNLTISHISTK
ncbi:MAG TPA: hypothetical protein VK186_28410 [Candidatus Deferrimicrobium sp.]|nr:hypothetical protein [Candidatus Deferrimicrobium sp.]